MRFMIKLELNLMSNRKFTILLKTVLDMYRDTDDLLM